MRYRQAFLNGEQTFDGQSSLRNLGKLHQIVQSERGVAILATEMTFIVAKCDKNTNLKYWQTTKTVFTLIIGEMEDLVINVGTSLEIREFTEFFDVLLSKIELCKLLCECWISASFSECTQ